VKVLEFVVFAVIDLVFAVVIAWVVDDLIGASQDTALICAVVFLSSSETSKRVGEIK